MTQACHPLLGVGVYNYSRMSHRMLLQACNIKLRLQKCVSAEVQYVMSLHDWSCIEHRMSVLICS